jgi:hypothetical protein
MTPRSCLPCRPSLRYGFVYIGPAMGPSPRLEYERHCGAIAGHHSCTTPKYYLSKDQLTADFAD